MKTRLVLDAVEGKQIMPAILGVCDGTLRANCENKTTTKIEAGSMAHRANVIARPSPAREPLVPPSKRMAANGEDKIVTKC